MSTNGGAHAGLFQSPTGRWGAVSDAKAEKAAQGHLTQLCILLILAKLSGEDRPWGIAHWALLRHPQLGPLLGPEPEASPH
jgi:hypothetical protein